MSPLARGAMIAAAVVVAVVVLFTWVFPWIERILVADPTLAG
ncbi:hypothetical protein [Euzebya sp.]